MCKGLFIYVSADDVLYDTEYLATNLVTPGCSLEGVSAEDHITALHEYLDAVNEILAPFI